MADKDLWFVLSMDDGVLGAWRTKAEALDEHTPGRDYAVIEVHRYGPGAYDVKWHYKGDQEDGGDFFLERGDSVIRGSGGWEWAYEVWEKAGKPLGHCREAVAEVVENGMVGG